MLNPLLAHIFERRHAEVFLEIFDEIVRVQMKGLRDLVHRNLRMQMAFNILLNLTEPINFL
ncbi:hypothetical protein D3C71_1860960 [compost metagenome]